MTDVKQHLLKELKSINRVFSQHGVGARVHAKRTAIAGSVYISYGVQLSQVRRWSVWNGGCQSFQRQSPNCVTPQLSSDPNGFPLP